MIILLTFKILTKKLVTLSKIKEISLLKLKKDKFINNLFYLFEKKIWGFFYIVLLRKKYYIIENFKINILILNNIISFEKTTINIINILVSIIYYKVIL